jgi:hypothetical protein
MRLLELKKKDSGSSGGWEISSDPFFWKNVNLLKIERYAFVVV